MLNLDKIINDAIRVSEKAAIACYDWIGKGESNDADQAAVSSMRNSLGEIVIGEGERDEAPMLYIGEKVGKGGLEVDIALDPLEGTSLCANAKNNSYTVIAFTQKGGMLNAPDVYMDKIAVGPNLPEGIIDLDNSVQTNLANLAKAKNKKISDLMVTILERERHHKIINECRAAGAKVRLIPDGDIAAIIDINQGKDGCADMYLGSGGAPEGVLAAASIKSTGGQMMGRLIFGENQKQIDRARKMGIIDLNKKYKVDDLVSKDAIFIASAVTSGEFVQGITKLKNKTIVSTIVMDSKNKVIKTIQAQYLS
jgi:fructose-1,6-bisphosphatase II / sedoheptulose-1,7-bisphosphatase